MTIIKKTGWILGIVGWSAILFQWAGYEIGLFRRPEIFDPLVFFSAFLGIACCIRYGFHE